MKALIALMRLNKPVGIYLLWFPCAWALCLAYPGVPDLKISIIFALGTIVMRSAGCVINDLADQKFDAQVQRTKDRPLAAAQLSSVTALICLFALLCIALLILLQLPRACFAAAIPALILTIIYPFCKRLIKIPQLILGLSFGASIPMVLIASHQQWSISWSMLSLITFAWVLAYDTQYALSDIKDDRIIGIYSSAILFQQHVYHVIWGLQMLITMLWIYLAWLQGYSSKFYAAIVLSCLFWFQQQVTLRKNPLQAFKQNTWYGLWIWAALLLEKL